MDDEVDPRTPSQVVIDVGRMHATYNPWVAMAAVVFRARPDAWMARWELDAWDRLASDQAWTAYRLGSGLTAPKYGVLRANLTQRRRRAA